MVRDMRYQIVSERLQDIATLVGKRQNDEVVLKSGKKVTPGLGLTQESSQLSKRATQLEKGEFLVICVGPVNAGKTTLVESISGVEMDSRATGIARTTAVITQTVYGNNLAEATLFEGEQPRNIRREEFWKDYTSPGTKSQEHARQKQTAGTKSQEHARQKQTAGTKLQGSSPDRFKKVNFALLEYNTPIYKQGFSFIDTPASFIQEALDSKASPSNFLTDADAILLTLNARHFVDSPDMARFVKFFKPSNFFQKNNIFFVFNNFDLRDEEKKEIEPMLRRLLSANLTTNRELGQDFFRARVFIVDALSARDAKLAGTGRDALQKTGLPALERELQALNEYSLEAIVKFGSSTLGEARREIERQRHLHNQSIAKLETSLDKIEEHLDSICQDASSIPDSYKELMKQLLTHNVKKIQETIPTFLVTSLAPIREATKNLSGGKVSGQGSGLIGRVKDEDVEKIKKNNQEMIINQVKNAVTTFQALVVEMLPAVKDDFETKSFKFTSSFEELQKEISSVKEELHTAFEEKRKAASVQEQQRLNTIDNLLTEQLVEIIRTVYEQDLTPEELIIGLPAVDETS